MNIDFLSSRDGILTNQESEIGKLPYFAKADYYILSSMAAAALRSLCFCVLLINLSLISLALAQDENQFVYNGFKGSNLHLHEAAKILPDGLLQLTNITDLISGYGFHPSPIKFNTSSSQSLSFSTNFVFALIPAMQNLGGNGMALVFSPSLDFPKAITGSYLGIFNFSTNGQPTNHILAIELDTVQSPEFEDIDGNHVGIDVYSLTSNDSATAAYFSDEEKKNKSVALQSGNPIQMWIDYNGTEKLLNVKLAPIGIPKPSRPLLSTSIDLSEIFLDTMFVGFSAATSLRKSDHYVLGWRFNKNGQAQDLDISKLPPPPPLRKTSKKQNPLMIVLVVVVVIMFIVVFGAIYIVRKKKYAEVYEDWEKEYGPHRISYKNLYKATKGFKEKVVIGRGGFGKVYKGVLRSPKEQIAIKRITHDSGEGMKQFVAEIVSMGRLRHRNLVQLKGYCRRKGELLLVYDYMPNGSLDKILYGSMRPNLNWFQRIRIVRGVACGLLYLHEEWEQMVLHRDIKPANVLLDVDLNGKLGDFGLARLYDHGSNLHTTNLVGTIGYLAPELLRTGKATTSSDVFSFGVLMLEVACGRRPMEPRELDLVNGVIECWKKGSILDAGDPRLEGIFAEEQMELILKLGLVCSHPNPAIRPSMRQVVQYLDGDAKFPDISPDSNVIGAFTKSNEAFDTMAIFSSSLFEKSSSHTMSTIDSIISSGR